MHELLLDLTTEDPKVVLAIIHYLCFCFWKVEILKKGFNKIHKTK